MRTCRRTIASSFASASTSATSSSTATIFSATASTLRRGSKASPSPAASAICRSCPRSGRATSSICAFEDLGEQAAQEHRAAGAGLPDCGSTRHRAAACGRIGQRPPLALPDKPSIAVLPFTNMSGDPSRNISPTAWSRTSSRLSQFQALFVIARNSSFTYKGQAVDVKQVGRELGVRYVLEGSVRKAGKPGAHHRTAHRRRYWRASLGGPVRRGSEDIFDLQDQVTENWSARSRRRWSKPRSSAPAQADRASTPTTLLARFS